MKLKLPRIRYNWAGQEAMILPTSLCPAQFWEFEVELLTRDWARAHQDTQRWTQKKNTFWCTFYQFEDQGNHSAGHMWAEKKNKKVSTIGCLGELELNHVSKFQVQNPKTQRGTAKILISSLYFKFIWNIYEAITPARKRIETWKYYWSSSYVVTHVHTNL